MQAGRQVGRKTRKTGRGAQRYFISTVLSYFFNNNVTFDTFRADDK